MSINEGDVLRANLNFTLFNVDRAMNVFHFIVTEAENIDETEFLDAVTDDIAAIYNLTLLSQLNQSLRGTTISWYKRDPLTATFFYLTDTDFNVVGLDQSDPLAPGDAAVVFFNHKLGGRRGRKFVYGLSESSTVNAQWSTTALVQLALWGSLMSAEIGDPGRKMLAVIVTIATLVSEYTGDGYVDARIGYQRRRKQGVGW